MSTSDARQRRSRLIAEMSRNIKINDHSITSSIVSKRIDNHDHSFASSTGSKHGTISSSSASSRHGTISRDSTRSTDFDPERDEALVSTQRMEFDVSQKLPQIRDTAKKYGRWAPKKQEDFKINTSAIGRAFPDFTQGDTEMSLSIEQPRSHHATSHSMDDSPLASITNGVRLRGSPRKPRSQSPILEALGRKESKEASRPRSTSAPAKDKQAAPKPAPEPVGRKVDKENIAPKNPYHDPYDSVDNDTFSTLPNPSPLKYQAQVDDDFTASSFGEGPSVAKPNTSQPLAAKISSTLPSASKIASQTAHTKSSFVIPSMPVEEISTSTVTRPVIQNGKVISHRTRQRPVNHFEGERQEENIYQMIDFLKEKVADLEKVNQSTQQRLTHLQKDNDQLATEKREADARCAKMVSGKKEVEACNALLATEKKAAEARNAQLAVEKREAEARIAQLTLEKTELEVRNRETQNATKKLEAKAADYDLVHGINAQAQRIIGKLQEKVADHEVINTESQEMIRELQRENEQLVKENELLIKENEEVGKENEQFGKENEQLGKENEQLVQQNDKLGTTNSEAHETITGLRKNMSNQDEEFTKKVTTLEEDLEKLARESRRIGRRVPSNDPDATMRPAQDPREALKEFIEHADTELAHMKAKLAELQKAYLAHDPAIKRRARKALKEEIDVAIKEIEIKSDKIYQLYDIKEGLAYY